MKLKPFKAWLLWDAEGTYSPHMHITRKEAQADKAENSHLIDAKWRIARVQVKELPQNSQSSSTKEK